MAQTISPATNGSSQLTEPGGTTEQHYEGTEKLLEVWFAPSTTANTKISTTTTTNRESTQGIIATDDQEFTSDLRVIPRSDLEAKILNIVKCEIISVSQNEDQTAYVLSESSLFVGRHRFILKTCGTTLLLHAIKPLMDLAMKYCGFEIADIFYSRKKFFRPDLQDSLYRNFDEEVAYLDSMFDSGAAYVLGRMNGECWYLYTLDKPGAVQEPDQTLEILMTNLDEDVMAQFLNTTGKNAKKVTQESGIADLLPKAEINEFLFEPCGYSMNGLLPNNGYMTIHITPEKEFSYVSFESNVAMEDYGELVKRIVKTFKPGKFVMTVFANETAKCGSSSNAFKTNLLHGYKRQDRQYSQFSNYDLTFGIYNRDDKVL